MLVGIPLLSGTNLLSASLLVPKQRRAGSHPQSLEDKFKKPVHSMGRCKNLSCFRFGIRHIFVQCCSKSLP